jgi:type VI secretion system secreted protein VgrG
VGSTIDVVQRVRDAERKDHRPFACRFRALPLATPFRPAEVTPPARQAGLQSGVVVGPPGAEVHPDGGGRVRVQLHWDRLGKRDAAGGRFMRVAQRGTGDSMLLPRIGWNVLTFNEEGSPDVPSVLSRIHDAEHPPAYPLPANKTRVVFKTATTPGGGSFNEVRYEDERGAEEMFMHASRDMGVLVQNDKTEAIDHDSKRAVAVDHALSIGKDHLEAVKNDQRVSIGANEKVAVKGDRELGVSNDLRQNVGASRDLHVGAASATQVGLTRSLQVGAVQVDVTLGPISCTSATTTSTTVGGAMIRATLKTLSEKVQLGTVQTIGGAKIELARRGLSISTSLLHAETVGGVMLLKSADKLGESALATSITAGGPMKIAAPKITVKGGQKITLSCGASSVTISDGAIEIKSSKVTLDGSVLDADAPFIAHG